MAQVEIDRGEELQTGQESADEEEQAEGGERRGPPEPEGFARGEHLLLHNLLNNKLLQHNLQKLNNHNKVNLLVNNNLHNKHLKLV